MLMISHFLSHQVDSSQPGFYDGSLSHVSLVNQHSFSMFFNMKLIFQSSVCLHLQAFILFFLDLQASMPLLCQ